MERIVLNLWSPLYPEYYNRDDFGFFEDELEEIDADEIVPYMEEIQDRITRSIGEGTRGLAVYLDSNLNEKVYSIMPSVEEHCGKLWGVTKVQLHEELNHEEFKNLMAWIEGQFSDGWGQVFEQREFYTENGELYVRFWSRNRDFIILPEKEFKSYLNAQKKEGMKISINIGNGEKMTISVPACQGRLQDILERIDMNHSPEDIYLFDFIGFPQYLVTVLVKCNINLNEINYLAEQICQMTDEEIDVYEGAVKICPEVTTAYLINAAHSLESFEFMPGVLTDEDLGEFFVTCELIDGADGIPYDIYKLLDRKRVGEEYRLSDKGEFTGKGYCYQSEEIVEIYDGKVLLENLNNEKSVFTLHMKNHMDYSELNLAILNLPASDETIQMTLEKLNLDAINRCLIVKVDGYLPEVINIAALHGDLEQLNELAELVADIQSKGEGMKYKAALVLENCNNLDSAMDIAKNMDCYEIRCENSTQYIIRYLQEKGVDTSDSAFRDFDFAEFGKRAMIKEDFVSTEYGIVKRNDSPYMEYSNQSGQQM